MDDHPTRSAPRFPFAGDAIVIPEGSDTKINTRVRELSLRGCYLSATNLLPTGSVVIVKIHAEDDFFEARATVVFSESVKGMGLSFRELKPHFQGVLQKWLRTAMANTPRSD